MTTGKTITIALTLWTFVSKMMSLLFNVLSCFPGDASGKEPACLCRRYKKCGFNLWVRKITWSRTWQPTAVFLPEEFHGQRSLAGYSPWGCKESDMTEHTGMHPGGRGQPGSTASTRTEPILQVLSCLGCLLHSSRVLFSLSLLYIFLIRISGMLFMIFIP